ncbi:hypothetical protein [Thalassotalea loyana]|uniref:hypothetical protein n=1 Tax=Thalassotalea loyana TaxID=280483 RepID=UPI0024E0F33E|nr:hypothetical protein [Thalassotalea loyana]
MNVYFESLIEANVDMFIPHVGFLIFIIAFYKFSPLFNAISDTLNVKKQKLLVALLLLFIFELLVGIVNFVKLSHYENMIKRNELLFIEGCIENYQSTLGNSRGESFEIKGVRFNYNNFATAKHFFANRKYGDNFIKNNQCVNVYYISENSQNHIVKIESL